MGYNRPGKRRTDRMKRSKKEAKRLLAKAGGQEGHGKAAEPKHAAPAK